MSDYGFFWDSRGGDRLYSADSMEEWLKPFFVTGVFNGQLQVTSTGGMDISVAAGYANIDGKIMRFRNATDFTLDSASGIYSRVDTVVVERNDGERAITLKVVKGDSSGQPTAPVRVDGVYQLVLAQIAVGQGVTSITQADITDTRTDSDLCGYVCATVDEIDFSQITAQWETYYENFVENQLADYTSWTTAKKAEWNGWVDAQELAFTTWVNAKKGEYDSWVTEQEGDYTDWIDAQEADFLAWYDRIKDILDESTAGHLQNEIDKTFNEAEYDSENDRLVFATVDHTQVPVTMPYVFQNNNTRILSAESWNDGVYDLTSQYPSNKWDVEIAPYHGMTEEQMSTYSKAKMIGSHNSNLIYATGEVPSIDIPVMIIATSKKGGE